MKEIIRPEIVIVKCFGFLEEQASLCSCSLFAPFPYVGNHSDGMFLVNIDACVL
jgi:hypothetical protein